MPKIRFLKIAIVKKETLSVEFTREEKDKSVTLVKQDHKAPIHQDLRNAMIGLRIHYALLMDYLKFKDVPDITDYDSDLVESFNVSSIHQGGAEDEAYVILTGSKKTQRNKSANSNTPQEKVTEDEKTRYKYMDELLERIEKVEDEVREYLQGKHAPETQQSLNFGDDEEDDDQEKGPTKAHILTPVTDPSQVGKQIADEHNPPESKENKPKRGGRRVPQSAQHKDGIEK